MRLNLFLTITLFLISMPASAAVLHFFFVDQNKQSFYHVSLEYHGNIYEADPRHGGHSVPVAKYKKQSDVKIYLPDSWVDLQILESQMGLKFDFDFVWDSPGTYCSKLVGLALKITPVPMTFVGTHYLQYHPEWINRNDPGISPEAVYAYGILHGVPLTP